MAYVEFDEIATAVIEHDARRSRPREEIASLVA
jgi:hypothetical protein